MTAERLAIEKAAEAIAQIAVDDVGLLNSADPVRFVAPLLGDIGHSGSIQATMLLFQRFQSTVALGAAPPLEQLAGTAQRIAIPMLSRLEKCIVDHPAFQVAVSLTPLLNRMAGLAAQCCALAVRKIGSITASLPISNALSMLCRVLSEAVVDRAERFRPLDAPQISQAHQAFAEYQAQFASVLTAELDKEPIEKVALAALAERPTHAWKNVELRQFWEARCIPKYDDAVPVDTLAVLLLRATSVETSLPNREAVMKRLMNLEQTQPGHLVAAEFDRCCSEVRRCGGLRAWVNALTLPGGVSDVPMGPLGTKRLAGCVPSMASTWAPVSAASWRSTSLGASTTTGPLSARATGSTFTTPRGEYRKPFALTSSSFRSRRSEKQDADAPVFDSVERNLLKATQRLILGDKASVDAKHNFFQDTALHAAAMQDRKHAPMANLLLERGADVNAEDRHLATALHTAAATGHREVARKCIQNGADVSKEDRWRATPLHRAAANGQKELADLLLESGASAGTVDEWGATPLHRAAGKGQLGVAESLLKNGCALVNAEDRIGDRPLHLAAKKGDYALVKLLLQHGGDKHARSRLGGKRPEDVARDHGHVNVVTLLQNSEEWINPRQASIAAAA